jgi:hypothetical protein
MDLVTAAREASEARSDVLIACAFNYDAHASEPTKTPASEASAFSRMRAFSTCRAGLVPFLSAH